MNALPAFALLCLTASAAFAQPIQTDLRDLRVGMALADLPREGYTDFTCAGPERRTIPAWTAFQSCPPDPQGRREVAFRYDDTPEHETQVAGQPVLLSLVLDQDGEVVAIRMQTDPGSRVFLRKRGVHFGERVMAHYGETGWSCSDAKPAAGELPIGTLFIRAHCEKTLGIRHLSVDRALFRKANQPPGAFTSTSSFTVSLIEANVR